MFIGFFVFNICIYLQLNSLLMKHFLLLTFVILQLQLLSQTVATNGEERLKSYSQKKKLQNQSPYKTSFRNIGPTVMSGRVVDVEANPDDPTEFYVAYASGGLWHTINNGLSFKPVFDSSDVLIIGDFAVNWKSKTRTIWLGTGEVNSSRSSYAGTGMYKTIDGGKTWKYLGLPESHHIGKVQLHPTNENIAWVAVLGHLYTNNAERGVYKTEDGGSSWKHQLFVNDSTGCVDMDINPQNPNELYAAMWQKTRKAWKFVESGEASAIYKSEDGGNTWNNITTANSGFMKGNKIGRIGIAVFPANPNIIYATVDNNMPQPDTTIAKVDSNYKKEMFKTMSKEEFAKLNNNLIDTFLKKNFFPRKYNAKLVKEMVANNKVTPASLDEYLDSDDGFKNSGIYGCEVYRSNDAGKTWFKTHTKHISINSTYGYYFAKIYTSHTNADKVFILGFSSQVSKDGGKNFSNMDKNNVHADHHALWVNPKKDSHLINGNDGGCNITYDDGENWFKANTPAVGQFYAITTDDAKPYNVYGGLQDNGVWYTPSILPRNPFANSGLGLDDVPAKSLGGGDGMQVQVDTRDNVTVYAGSQFGNYYRRNRMNSNRADVKGIQPEHELGEKPLRYNWQTPIVLSKHNQDVLYYGANRFYRSLVKGDTLIAMSSDLSNGKKEGNVPYGTITAISESTFKFGLVYAGTDDGNLHVTTDGGYTWKQLFINITTTQTVGKKTKTIVTNPPKNLWVSRVVASQHKEGRVYATLNGYRFDDFAPYVYVSDDFGITWKDISGNLPLEPVNVLREDNKKDSLIYIGTDGGLYVSHNIGNNYNAWKNGLPVSVPIHDIAIQTRENEIVLGTHGRSLYIAKLDAIQSYIAPALSIRKGLRMEDSLVILNPVKRKKEKTKEIDLPCPTNVR